MIILHPCCQARLHSRKITSAVTLTSEHCPSQPFPRSIGCRWRSVFLIIATNTLSLHNIPLFFIFPTLYVENCNKEKTLKNIGRKRLSSPPLQEEYRRTSKYPPMPSRSHNVMYVIMIRFMDNRRRPFPELSLLHLNFLCLLTDISVTR